MFSRKLWKKARGQGIPLFASIFFGVILGGLVILQAWLLSLVISQVFLEQAALSDVREALFRLLGVILLRGIVIYFREVSAGLVSIQVQAGLKRSLFEHVLNLGPINLQQSRTGEVVALLGQGVERLDPYFCTYLPQLGLAAMLPVIILVAVFPVDWLTGLIFVMTAPLIPMFMVLIGKEAEKRTTTQWKLLSRLSGHFLDVLQGIRTLKAFGLSRKQGRMIEKVSEEYASVTLGVLRVAFLSALTLELIATISTAIVAVQIGLRLMNGGMVFANALFVLIMAPEFYLPLRQLGAAFHSGMDGVSAAVKIFDFLEQEPLGERAVVRKAVPHLPAGNGIVFRGITYTYATRAVPSLQDVDLEIPWGQQTAIIGKSGAGKSTLFSLLIKFTEPDSGEILIGSQRLAELSGEGWRRRISWVPQFPYLFHATILENILVARPTAPMEEVFFAARQAGAEVFINQLARGYDTVIGERGTRLSGGQAQRIAIARAFLKDAPILLLDEPTTGIDVGAEKEIFLSLANLKQNRTVIQIIHRLSSIRQMDFLVFMENGRVAQSGYLADLIGTPGKLRELFRDGGTAG